jgi:signal peptidase II
MEITKQNIFLALGALFIIISDLLTKYWAHTINGSQKYLFFTFQKIYNSGISFGQFSSGEPFVRIVFLSLFFGIIFLTFTIVIFYFLNKKHLFSVRYPIMFFISGVIGNGVDRIFLGKVTDFIIFTPYPYIVFNIADIFIAIFGLQSIYIIIKRANDIWFEENLRGFKIIDSHFQWSFSFKFAVISFFSNFLMASFCYTVLNVVIKSEVLKEKMMGHISLGFLGLTIFFTLFGLFFGLIITNRSAGPIYALKRFLNDLKSNPDAKLMLREQDYHKDLELIASDIKSMVYHK